MSRPLVSVITPTYNHEKFIGQCIESVLGQTFPDWEQIIIDDGSTDRTPEIIRRYRDPRIRCYRLSHRGISNLVQIYNKALHSARGELLAILEGDDFWPKRKLENQIKAFETPDVILVWGNGVVVDEYSHSLYIRQSVRTSNELEDFSASTILKMLRGDNPITPTCTVMVRKNSVMAIGGFQSSPSGIYVDLPTWLVLALNQQGIFRFYNQILGYWRTHSKQTTSIYRGQLLRDHAMLICQHKLEGYASYSRYLQARGALIDHNWGNARSLFAKLIFDRTIEKKEKVICTLGLLSTLMGVDLIKLITNIKNRMVFNFIKALKRFEDE